MPRSKLTPTGMRVLQTSSRKKLQKYAMDVLVDNPQSLSATKNMRITESKKKIKSSKNLRMTNLANFREPSMLRSTVRVVMVVMGSQCQKTLIGLNSHRLEARTGRQNKTLTLVGKPVVGPKDSILIK